MLYAFSLMGYLRMPVTILSMLIPGAVLLMADAPVTEPAADIVVNATRGRCEIVYAGSALDGRGIARLADGWPAGRPLRVMEPRAAKRKCLVKVMLELSRRGFTTVQFVSPPEP
jgi:hypothetical protein